ncbi:MAG: TonB-dependent receptor [Bacteroidetes bacterium]|nr:MAG: TonB-dependent receptor [Bacteroidota bacterium]REK51759.1 MAG: TonB-dependent receptor [Bacteroidota bacterium]
MKIKALFTALLFSVLSYAQNGIIRGTVYEDETSEALFYANAQIPSTGAVAFTDFDGNFELSLEPGTYNLEISFLGLATLTISDVKVEAGKVTAFENLRLKPSTNELMTVTVTASAMRNTESALLNVKKKSATVMDGISAQNFKRVGDGNAAAAVTRVPGVSIQGGKYVFVRGLGDRYTKTQLMRMDIPGLDPDRNSLQMDIFPTNILQNIVVLKTLTADLPADFSGGLVNIELVDFPTKKTLNISSSLGYTPGMHLVQGLGHQGSVTDFLGFDSGFRNNPLPNQYIYQGIPNPALDDPITTELTESFKPVLSAKARTMPLNGSLGISGGNQFKKDNGKTVGYNGSFSYKANTDFFGSMTGDSTRMYEQNFYRKGNLPTQYELQADRTQIGSLAVSNIFMSGLFGYSIKDDNDKYRFTAMHLQNGETRTGKFIETSSIENSFIGARDNLEYSERSITSLLFNGQHSRKDNTLKIDWRIAPTYSRIADKDIRSTSYRTEDNTFAIAPGETGFPNRIWRNLNEFNLANRIDFTRTHEIRGRDAKFKYGASYTFKYRDYEILRYQLRAKSLGNLPALTGDADELLTEAFVWDVISDAGTYYSGNYEANNAYQGIQSNFGAYVNEEFNMNALMKVVVGLRLERYDQFYTGVDQQEAAAPGTGLNYYWEPVLNNFNLFPTASFIYSVNENSNLRLGAFRTVARPSFKEKSAAQIEDVLTGITFIGNLDLQNTIINNLDARYEYFFEGGQTVALSGFYKMFQNPIELVAYSAAAPSNFQPRNVGNATVAGAEFEIRKNLGFVGLKNFEVNSNFSYIYSAVTRDSSEYAARLASAREGEIISEVRPMQGQSPYMVNVGLNYNNPKQGWQGGLFYNVQGEKLYIVGVADNPDVYEVPFHSLNFNLMKRFGEERKYQIGVAVSNILDDTRDRIFVSYNSSSPYFSRWAPGRTFKLTFRYSL